MKLPLSKTRTLEITFDSLEITFVYSRFVKPPSESNDEITLEITLDSFMPQTIFDWILVISFVFAMAWAGYVIWSVH